MKLFKKAGIKDAVTIPNIFFIIVMGLILIYVISFLLKQFFGTKVIPIGTPLTIILVGFGLITAFYFVVVKKAAFDRTTLFSMIIILGIISALVYYLPTLLPEIFSAIPQDLLINSPESPFIYLRNASVTLHNSVQSVIPIP